MLKYEYFHVFKFDNEYIIYDYYNSTIFEISEKMYIFLTDLDKLYNDAFYNNERLSFDYLVNQGYLLSSNKLDEDFENDCAFLSFAPAYRCNLRCKYCFAQCGSSYDGDIREYTSESLKYMLDYFFLKAFPNRKSYRIDFVSGGEPLINFNIVKQTVEYCEEIISKKDITIKVWLCTNGTLLTDDICNYLDAHKMTIGISIDGPQYMHDLNRVDRSGNGTYYKVIEAIKRIQKSDTLSPRFKGIWGLSVLNDKNINLIDIVTHHRDIGLRDAQIKIERRVLPDNFSFEKYKKEYFTLMKQLIDEAIQGDYSKLRLILNEEDYLGKFLIRIITNQYTTLRCNAGKCKMTICPNGDIYPCDSFVGICEMKLGNMFDSIQSSTQFSDININTCQPCSSCSVRFLCGGDCYYNSYINTGKINTVHPKMCDMLKYLCELAIWGCYHLQKEAKEIYDILQTEMIRIEKIRHQI